MGRISKKTPESMVKDIRKNTRRLFNKKYGTGAKGYTLNSEFFFDINSFRNEGVESMYFNPRNGFRNPSGYTSHFRIHWSDVGYFLVGRIL